MSLHTRLSLGAAVAIAVALAAASTLAYYVVRGELRGQVDSSLDDRRGVFVKTGARVTARGFFQAPRKLPAPKLGGPAGYVQVVDAHGKAYLPATEKDRLPVDAAVRAVAAGTHAAYLSDAIVAGTHVRVLTAPAGTGTAVQIARPLTEVDHALSRLKLLLLAISVGGVALAAGLGRGVARAALMPVRRLTQAAERIAATHDLRSRADTHRSDELGRLAGAFNTMLDALAKSVAAQRQLVADASHELRTPLASARTNLEVLELDEQMPLELRRKVLADAVGELEEMTHLIEELVELARGEQQALETHDVRLDLVARQAVAGAARRWPGVTFAARFAPTLVLGSDEALGRAIVNLLDNAAKWSPPGGVVDVEVKAGTVTVRDRGPGIDPEDVPYVFDRFYRSVAARSMPGSGLGLAIVKQIAETHGGSVAVEPAAGRGSVFRLRLGARDTRVPRPRQTTARSPAYARRVRGLGARAAK